MQFDVIFTPDSLRLFGAGLVGTLQILIACLLIGGALALPMTLMRVSQHWWVKGPVWLFTYVVRGTPLLIQVYIIYYGVAQLDWIQSRWDDSWPWTGFKDPFMCAVLAFSMNTCAYTVEMLAGGIRDTNAGEIEAAHAMGLSKWQTLARIVLPSAMRRTLPAYSNEVIMMLHSTSLASTVPAVFDITGAARSIYSDFYLPFEAFITAGLIYLVLTFTLVGLFRLAENHWLAYLKPRGR
ncbi:MAG: ABC transporter permease [Burkholderiales bacterium]|jgi:arginine/ornithine transport system permease protein|tara:strand:+ start:2654 stop:3367 length:714 start_codon:yes stop_codon:yes gene_type:complete